MKLKQKLTKVQVHEAGHIVAARQLRLPVTDAWASLTRDEGGVDIALPDSTEYDFVLAPISASGAAAEIAYFGRILNPRYQLEADYALHPWASWAAFEHCARGLAKTMSKAALKAAAKEVRLV